MAACLTKLSIPYAIVEREDCSASLWRNRAYGDRLKLHLAKEFCELPHMSYPTDAPTYIPKDQFVKYLDDYIERFNIKSCSYDEGRNYWFSVARDMTTPMVVRYTVRFLVVASGGSYSGKNNVLVVGCGNSGMEIAYDLASHGCQYTSIVVRSPMHVVTKEIIRLGMTLVQHVPVNVVDDFLVRLSNFVFGDLSGYVIVRPKLGPLLLKAKTGRSAVIDVGTVALIKNGTIKVLGNISKIKGNTVEFEDRKESAFDAIVFATGYKSTANTWLKNGESMLNNDGLPKKEFPNHWKGANGLYCAGLAKRGSAGIAMDAKNIAK
ncbi:putative indole-3-pyruvate monooxygenase YUCCA11 [Dichanthelium oligosanthes]|uniref:Flavin-containing monooxygenase n=1 Tax=Dichanthelium oligosanthes TaxID=888268 RepID=A0A1E5VK14_9POAL|nr:putative indole-3-pyruvate monooxygenase YUCCA11 [Dichanthelium oligosanthes]